MWLSDLYRRVRALLRAEAIHEEIDEEMRFHIEMRADENVRRGMSPEEARLDAERRFGKLTRLREQAYQVRGGRWVEAFWQDARYGVRTLRKSTGFTLVAVLTLAVGIGANAAIFSVLDAVLLRQLPYPDAERLVKLYGLNETGESVPLSPADFLESFRQANSFQHLTAYRESAFNLAESERPERVNGAVVLPDFFSALGVQARLGRTMVPELDRPGGGRIVVLSYGLWQRVYGGDAGVIGRAIKLDGERGTVVGVMPKDFQFPAGSELWASARYAVPEHPLRPESDPSGRRDTQYFEIIGRLKPGVTLEQARAEADAIAQRLRQQYGDDEESAGASVVALHEEIVGGARTTLLVLVGAAAILLLISCANVANILLARGATRQKEISIRMALGAGRVRLVRQLLTEGLLLATAGGLSGILLALWSLTPLKALLPADMIGNTELKLDARVLAFTALVTLGSALLFGLFPALTLARTDLNGALKEGGRGAASGARARRTRSLLVVSEIALAAVLLTGAGLLVRSFSQLLAVPLGFNPEHVLSAQLTLPQTRYPKKSDRAFFVRQVIERVNALPATDSTAVISRLPLSPGGSTRSVEIEGHAPASSSDIAPDYLVVSPDYFASMGIPLLRGRDFAARDDANSPGVVIVNEAMARQFWPGEDAVGRLLKVGEQTDWSQVVGVVGDARQRTLDRTPSPAVYVPYAQDPWPFMSFVVRTKADPSSVAASFAAAVRSVDKDEPVYSLRPMNDVVAASLSSRRWRMLILALFAFVALALASLGVYGVMAYSVTQRRHEFGIRLTLGARRRDVLKLVIAQGVRLALVGTVLGLVAALALTRLVASLLYGVSTTDPVTFIIVPATLVCVTLLACYLPARRATRVDPLAALRYE